MSGTRFGRGLAPVRHRMAALGISESLNVRPAEGDSSACIYNQIARLSTDVIPTQPAIGLNRLCLRRGGQGRDFLDLRWIELPLDRANIRQYLLATGSASDDAADRWLGRQPGNRQLEHGVSAI
jgi:hypothetical protein